MVKGLLDLGGIRFVGLVVVFADTRVIDSRLHTDSFELSLPFLNGIAPLDCLI